MMWVCISITISWASYQIRKIAGWACAWNVGDVFPATDFKGNRSPSRYVRYARAAMHVGIANPRWRGNVPSIPSACPTRNFAYLARRPCLITLLLTYCCCQLSCLWIRTSCTGITFTITINRFMNHQRKTSAPFKYILSNCCLNAYNWTKNRHLALAKAIWCEWSGIICILILLLWSINLKRVPSFKRDMLNDGNWHIPNGLTYISFGGFEPFLRRLMPFNLMGIQTW